MKRESNYVLFTAARNEECYIENTVQCVIAQTMWPKKWVIISDGSTDRTEEIVSQYAKKYDFIKLIRVEPMRNRSFASKVNAIRKGSEHLKNIDYDYIGNLDADVSFEPYYYESILKKFQENPKLGIAGGMLFEFCNGKWIRQVTSSSLSASGPVQMFRRQCYVDIGGYIPMRVGGEDAVAEVSARMHCWNVQTFSDLKVLHLRRTGTEKENILRARFNQGRMEYSHG